VSALRASRRGFLALLGGGAALAALARLPSAAASPSSGGPLAASGEGERFFSPEETEILTRVVERMAESGDPRAPRVRETRAVATIDALCQRLDPALTAPLPALLRAVEWGPWLFDLAFARFRELDATAMDASLRGWMTSRFGLRRQGFQALRNLAFLGYYAQEETWARIGYAGPLLRRAAPLARAER
jgi:hypothetical protein